MIDALNEGLRRETELPCRCEDCGLRYATASWGGPATAKPYTCDDCGGYVMDADETREADAE